MLGSVTMCCRTREVLVDFEVRAPNYITEHKSSEVWGRKGNALFSKDKRDLAVVLFRAEMVLGNGSPGCNVIGTS